MWPGRPPARSRISSVGGEDALERTEQQRRIEIALDAAVGADALPRFVERRPPVGADHVAAGLAQLVEDRCRCRRRNESSARRSAASAIEDLLRVRQDELAVVGRVQRADPRVEHLHAVARRLRSARRDSRRRCPAIRSQKRCHAAGWPYISALVCAKLFEWPPSIAYDASVNGAPAKPISGTRPPQRLLDLADRLEHVAELPRAARTRASAPGRLRVRSGLSIAGPSPLMKSKGMPIGSSGSSRSENRIAASTSMRRTGCSVTSVARSGVRQISSSE